jgi:hypothetical protein
MKWLFSLFLAAPMFAANITGVWANDGGDKVAQDELRVYRHTENLTGKVKNKVWNGTKVSLFGARNEVVSFNLTLEAAKAKAVGVKVVFRKKPVALDRHLYPQGHARRALQGVFQSV